MFQVRKPGFFEVEREGGACEASPCVCAEGWASPCLCAEGWVVAVAVVVGLVLVVGGEEVVGPPAWGLAS